ncbi:diaminobutyrate--2-oxoglutarate transaminase [Sphingomonas oleivorans]|uniref:Diaminobutyrate--2-oxoglutarate transaminase n=1 Tax=Sphingomonas oleivorans TaxID=1735121 RepID=A0A2T5G012_9SPHN|nr:diaminobutyrate--2-oxoglutarate transaminase [Sphingomonas oleivorans]PTQ12275.1 diaminobutyrate--2-oxoglutarate transaminase [Sphingomonas oleivorans]
MKSIFEILESGVQSYARQFPATFDRALGSQIFDVEGRRYLDFFAGAGALNYGHNNPVLKKVLIEYIESNSITHSLDLHTVAKAKFLNVLDQIILKPRGLDRVVQFTGPTGTNAVEAAMKLARKITGRTNIFCFTNGFHGVSTGSLSVTGNKYIRSAAGIPLSLSTVLPYDGYFGDHFDTIDYLERVLDDPSSGVDDPAAVIVEALQGEGGLNAASAQWLRRLERVCRTHGIILILDDIQCGCGRTGSFFSFEEAGIDPDIVTLSKSLSAFGLPLAIVLIRRDLDMWKPGEHNGTFRGNNLAFVTAAAAIEHFWADDAFTQAIRRKSAYLAKRLGQLVDTFPEHLSDVRGRGMMQGVRCADPQEAAEIATAAFARGLIIERAGPRDEVLKCLMPLTISDDELEEGLDMLEASVRVVVDHVPSAGIIPVLAGKATVSIC